MVNKLIVMVCLGLCSNNYAIITTREEALSILKQHMDTAHRQEQQERYKALLLVQDSWLIYGIQPDKVGDFYNAIERGDIPAMQACLKHN